MREEIRKTLKNGGLYDFICNNYYNMEKYELAEIIKELDFAIYTLYGESATIQAEKEAEKTLTERGFFDN